MLTTILSLLIALANPNWIGWEGAFPWDVETNHSRLSVRYLRTEFSLDKEVQSATLDICGLGLYECYINGSKVSDDVLTPAPTDYRRTIFYNTYDVTSLLSKDNAVGVALGPGRYYAMQQHYKPYKVANFGYPKLWFKLKLVYKDGTKENIVSTERWKLTAEGPIRAANEYDGEIYDARMELGDWTKVGYDDSSWHQAQRTSIPKGDMEPQSIAAMAVMQTLPVKSITPIATGYVIDFGQNMAGWVKMRLSSTLKDQEIKLIFAETVNPDGTLYRANFRNAYSQDTYTCSGKENGEWWHPVFTTHGFRYVEVRGIKDPKPEDFVAELVYDNIETTGHFECSNDVINAVYHNAWWGVASNYKGMPIDCPQRDERMPWLGDRVAGSLGESFMFDIHALYSKWMRDIREAQRYDGAIPDVAPAFWNYYSDNMTWPAALPMGCDMLWEQYGDLQPIKDSYAAICKWMDYMKDSYMDENGLITKDQYGDWCMPPERLDLVHSADPARITDGTLISTAYYVKISQLLSKFASLQGLRADAKKYARQAEETSEAFNKAFLTVKRGQTPEYQTPMFYPDSVFYGNNTVTANVLPLAFGIVPDEYRQDICNNIIKKIVVDGGGHISSGVIGLQWIQHELTKMGRSDVAFSLASQTGYPSYGYMVKQGATTIWELWNGNTANPSMNSGNHVMLLGDLVSWYYHDLAGIRPYKPGYEVIELKPDFTIDDLQWVNASFKTIHGVVESNWKKTLNDLEWDFTVPAGTKAKVWIPGKKRPKTYRPGTYHIEVALPHKKRVLEESFLYWKAKFPQCHASTIEQLPNGDLIAAYFGGTAERNPDVCIWTSRKPKGSKVWEEPQYVADGVQNENLRYPTWNPVLFQIPDGDLLLFYKTGPSPSTWWGCIRRSSDGGHTWSAEERLPDGILGAIKDKPVMLKSGRIVSGSSTEGDHWRVHFELSDDGGHTWRKVGPVNNPHGYEAIQPTILKHRNGALQALCRTKDAFVGTTWSYDDGETWSDLELIEGLPQNQSGLDAVTLRDGSFALVYNNVGPHPGTTKGPRTPLSVALSKDGLHWKNIVTLEDCPLSQYSYPAIIQDKDGNLDVVYTWRRTRVKYVKVDY
ncbi:MAG: family 78 glycoside hydrolase catalytic domain [Bacteroidales bacterium]|nr:family 78 glycoside hydrolase catalytic domain [Bacteroidales bacterium]